jgi:hypothetical protein
MGWYQCTVLRVIDLIVNLGLLVGAGTWMVGTESDLGVIHVQDCP